MTDVAIIGGGPAGLIAAERLAEAGLKVAVYDRMPSLGRKLLMAGRGGLNLTHSEPLDWMLQRYGSAASHLEPALRAFPPEALRAWAHELGEDTFVGSSGRVFPKSFKASPLLRAWLRRLDAFGVSVHTRHIWRGWSPSGALVFGTPDGSLEITPARATLLALGGASWPKLGADGGWTPLLAAKGVEISPLAAANSGVRIAWSDTFRDRFAGQPVKRVVLGVGEDKVAGEMVVTRNGLEGGAIYALSRAIRFALESGSASLTVDLKPDLGISEIAGRLARPRKGETASNFLRKTLTLSPIQIGLLREAYGKDLPSDPEVLANAIKSVRLDVTGTEGLDRAISTAGGVSFAAVDETFMLRALPGTFVAGEMLDWEAPTGGYLLQACFSTGVHAANGILAKSGPGG
jgi:uncharacterized flavoprotein (TIGR03862 family)